MAQYTLDDLQKFIEADKVLLLLCDTIYGLVAKAPKNLQQIKGRPETKPFLQLYGSLEQLKKSPWKMPSRDFLKYWPGPLTCILSSKSYTMENIRENIMGEDVMGDATDSQAVRIPQHELLQNLCLKAGIPLYSTSANRSGEATSNQEEQLLKIFAREIAEQLVIPYFPSKKGGVTKNRLASTVVDTRVTPPKILRQGSLHLDIAKPE